jgi:hypothetical protein
MEPICVDVHITGLFVNPGYMVKFVCLGTFSWTNPMGSMENALPYTLQKIRRVILDDGANSRKLPDHIVVVPILVNLICRSFEVCDASNQIWVPISINCNIHFGK